MTERADRLAFYRSFKPRASGRMFSPSPASAEPQVADFTVLALPQVPSFRNYLERRGIRDSIGTELRALKDQGMRGSTVNRLMQALDLVFSMDSASELSQITDADLLRVRLINKKSIAEIRRFFPFQAPE